MTHTAAAQASLRWVDQDGRDAALQLWPERSITIGRDATSAIVLDSAFVSKRHAIVNWTAGEFQVTDGGSSNGTRVNGSPITTSALRSGDVLEIGDYRLTFELGTPEACEDERTSGHRGARVTPPSSGNKGARLIVAALVTMGVMIGGLALLLRAMTAATTPAAVTRPRSHAPTAEARPVTPSEVAAFDRTRARDAAAQARRTGVEPLAATYDQAMVASRAGRYLEAVQLLAAVLADDPKHEGAKSNLPRAMAAREREIQEHQGEARQAEFQLRFDAAARHWEQVLSLTEPREAAHADAQKALAAISSRSARE